MTGLLVLPTKVDGSIGRVKNTLPENVGVGFDLDYYETAAEAERAKDALLAIASRLGLANGTTPGSFEAMKVGFEVGSGLSILVRNSDGTYASTRLGTGPYPPTVADGYTAGFRAGSWWVQRAPGEGLGTPEPITLWVCVGDTDGAAAWQVMPSPAAVVGTEIGRAGAAGVLSTYARADHAHDGGVQPIRTVTASATLTNADAIVLVNTTAADVYLTLPTADRPGRNFRIKKINAGSNLIVLVPHDTSGMGPKIEDGANGVAVELPDSGAAARHAWFAVWDGARWWL